MSDNKKPVLYRTRSLSLAAYLYMHEFELRSGRKTSKRGPAEYVFVFVDPEKRCEEIAKKFPNSESSRHDECTRFLKNFVNDCSMNASSGS